MAQGKEEKKIPVMKMSGLGVSIKHPRADEEQQKRTVSTVQQDPQPEEDFIFNEKDVNYYWQEYAGRLPRAAPSCQTYASNPPDHAGCDHFRSCCRK